MSQQFGMTLIELMIVLAISGIIMSMAIGEYSQYVAGSKRSDAKLALLQVSNQQEKFFSNTGTYAATLSSIGYTAESPGGHYDISIVSVSSTAYLLSANAKGNQIQDESCARFTLSRAGEQEATTKVGGDNSIDCWGNKTANDEAEVE
ncbi:MAG: type IV pilus assembly protein PilE [Parasphingorhabdus sp.]|jgi:type IV pilus assembly protein PilE